jgi:hypothetical protein
MKVLNESENKAPLEVEAGWGDEEDIKLEDVNPDELEVVNMQHLT